VSGHAVPVFLRGAAAGKRRRELVRTTGADTTPYARCLSVGEPYSKHADARNSHYGSRFYSAHAEIAGTGGGSGDGMEISSARAQLDARERETREDAS